MPVFMLCVEMLRVPVFMMCGDAVCPRVHDVWRCCVSRDGVALAVGSCPFGVCLWVGAPVLVCTFVSRGVGG